MKPIKESSLNDVKIEPIKITLKDKEHFIIYDYNAFAELEEYFKDDPGIGKEYEDEVEIDGKKIKIKLCKTSLDIMFERVERPSLKDLRIFIWAGMIHEIPEYLADGRTQNPERCKFTPSTVGSLMNGLSDLQQINNAIFKAIEAAMPKGKEEDLKNVETQGKKEE